MSDIVGNAQAAAFVDQASVLPIPHIVFNAATTSLSATEVASVLSFGQRQLALLIMNPVMAKTYGQSLLSYVEKYEQVTGQVVLTIDEINARVSAASQHE